MKRGELIVCWMLALALGLIGPVRGQELTVLEGFGTTTSGGSGGTVVEVTSLADSGPGTLREALAQGDNLTVVFGVGGTIDLQSPLDIRGQAFLTIDGASAPPPGITLSGQGLYIIESHDIIVRHIRVRDAAEDGISIRRGSSYVVIDHCSTTNAADENMAITADATDVTVSWSIIGDTRPESFDLLTKGMLISSLDADGVTRVSLHHNLFINEAQRNPEVDTAGLVDIRNNVIMDWRVYGIMMTNGVTGNIVNNVFVTTNKPHRAVFLKDDAGPVYIAGNQGPGTTDVNALSTATTAFAVAPVTMHPVEEVRATVLEGAGALPRDDVDTALAERQELQALSAFEGFGATTLGGSEGLVVEVTSLADSGPGTLREALTRGDNLTIVFEVGGTIDLQSPLEMYNRAFVTIDGSSAPPPGITLRGEGVKIFQSHDIVVQHIRVRQSASRGLWLREVSNVVIDHCSLTDASKENLAVTLDATDVTVSWSIIGDTREESFDLRTKGMLVSASSTLGVTRLSLHHNLFTNEYQRSPQVQTPGLVDLRNNLIMNWRVYGIQMRDGAFGNIVENVFATAHKPHRAVFLQDDAGPVYIAGNLGPGTTDVNALSTTTTAFEVALVTTDPAAEVEAAVRQGAGAFPRDSVDTGLVQQQ